MFTSLYRNVIEAAPRGSKISVTSDVINDFFLIKIHNVSVIPDEFIDNFDQLFVTANNATGTGIGVYLAFLIIKELAGELYFHTSVSYGTTFYIKLPNKSACNQASVYTFRVES
ncbi:ATP-binding protein [Candidatus Colwellia aromaticivorans]|uniref:ATP-binding protein n=1 Tax=Candidatus Colwellia aromaticivorans TaxID=2267621 RepID=UPI000DF224F5|nr:ATP-binding protein [Candidatus Colwellia aromaticivorans]